MGRWKKIFWVGAGAVDEAGLTLKMRRRYFPKVKKPHNHNLGNQERAANLKYEVEFPCDI